MLEETQEGEWLSERRSALLGDLLALRDGGTEMVSVPELVFRMEQAERIHHQTMVVGQELWARAIADIADPQSCPHYQGLSLSPQIGLLPLAKNPQSGLWEFLVWGTGGAPQAEDGDWKMTADTGVVMVLLPGGDATIGADRADDPRAYLLEGPRHTVALQPFFISKYELTRRQWETMDDVATFRLHPLEAVAEVPDHLPTHPKADLNWMETRLGLARFGLECPSEEQWEYAARAGSSDPWICQPEELHRYANLRDLSAQQFGIETGQTYEKFEDGHAQTAPVGSYSPNGFGLYDTHGNLYEWCRDELMTYDESESDPNLSGPLLDLDPPDVQRVVRGGSYMVLAFGTRLTLRVGQQARRRSNASGVRPARRVYGLADGE